MLNRTIAKIVFYIVAAVLFTWTASLTVSFLQMALPNTFWAVPYLGLVIFDGGLIAWMIVFLSHAQGAIQRATALMLTIINLLGVGLMVVAEILLDGQQLTAAPESLGTVAIWAIGIWTIINVAGVVLFHLGDNEARKEMAIQSEKDAIFEGALKELGKLRSANQAQLAQELSGSMFAKLVSDLHADRDGDGTPDIMQRGRQDGPRITHDDIAAYLAANPEAYRLALPVSQNTHDTPRHADGISAAPGQGEAGNGAPGKPLSRSGPNF